MTEMTVNPGGTPKNESAIPMLAAAGVSIFACPSGKRRVILSLCMDIIMTATAGNRTVYCGVRDVSASKLWLGSISANVAAAQTLGYDIAFGTNNLTPTTTVRRAQTGSANVNVMVRENCPVFTMKAGDYIFVDDTANIDATDQVSAYLTFLEYDA